MTNRIISEEERFFLSKMNGGAKLYNWFIPELQAIMNYEGDNSKPTLFNSWLSPISLYKINGIWYHSSYDYNGNCFDFVAQVLGINIEEEYECLIFTALGIVQLDVKKLRQEYESEMESSHRILISTF